MEQRLCLRREQLEDFALGRVSADQEREIAAHLDECSECQEAAARFDGAADSFIASLPAPDASAQPPDDAHCLAALARAKRLASPSRAEFAPPTWLRDYELLRKLGEGGMGTVYQARHTRLGRDVALKILSPESMRDPLAMARFEREMQAVGALDHPAIVRATDAGDIDGAHFLVMEHVAGLDLASLAERIGPLPAADACELVRQAALGLEHVHERGMVHRDMKPSNLMLTPQGQVKILDLGLALLHDAGSQAHGLTTVGRFMGTLDYMAPEQADDSHAVDIRADVYALGATLYRLLCGTAPFGGEEFRSPLKKIRALALLPVPPLRQRRPDAPAALARVVERMLAKSPDDRFATPAEAAKALRPFAQGANLPALIERARQAVEPTPFLDQGDKPSGTGASNVSVKSLERPSRRRAGPARWLGALLAGAAMLAAGLVIYIQTDRGSLIVRSSDPSVQVLVRRAGRPVDEWEVQQGPNRTTLRSGEYELVLIGASDGLRIQDGAFTLTRGGQHVATIERAGADAAAARPGDRRALEAAEKSRDRLKQLGLAMHNFVDAHNRFPPAVGLGPDGKTPHSWRVALLPFLGRADLYNEYRLDEAWDSEHNMRLLAKMPDVYRHPTAAPNSIHAAYFLITSPTARDTSAPSYGMMGGMQGGMTSGMMGMSSSGGSAAMEMGAGMGPMPATPRRSVEMGMGPMGQSEDGSTPGFDGGHDPLPPLDAIFSSKPQRAGPRMADFTDGTSNVLLIVEDRREEPWTKPEDIPFGEMDLGGYWSGGFFAAFADGFVRFLPDTLPRETLQKLIDPDDGEPIDPTALEAALPTTRPLAAPRRKAPVAAREAAPSALEDQRRRSQHHLKQLGVAMHNFHDTYRRFPPAVRLGPDGKTPHSWRVALLPFLGYDELYKEYRLNEPWNSEHNRRLLPKMPGVYQHPSESSRTISAAYFLITSPTARPRAVRGEAMMGDGDYDPAAPMGEGAFGASWGSTTGLPGGARQDDPPAAALPDFDALFSSKPQKEGPWLGEILDGTSNTLMIVEARRDVPWTKPEDIPFQDLDLGGYWEDGFFAARADGAVRFLPATIGRNMLQKLIDPADYHPIDWEALDAGPNTPSR